MMWPELAADSVVASINGSSNKPELVAVSPRTSWMKTGRNTTAAKNADVEKNSPALLIATIGLRWGGKGRTGSGPRCSGRAKAPEGTCSVTLMTASATAPRGRLT